MLGPKMLAVESVKVEEGLRKYQILSLHLRMEN